MMIRSGLPQPFMINLGITKNNVGGIQTTKSVIECSQSADFFRPLSKFSIEVKL